MKLVVAGSRSIDDDEVVALAIDEALREWGLTWESISSIVSGGARGVDRHGERIADALGVPKEIVRPDYHLHGRYLAPKIRNGRMADIGDRLVAVWDGKSGGTEDMIEKMSDRGKPFYVHKVQGEDA